MTYSITITDRVFTTGGHIAAICDLNRDYLLDHYMLFADAIVDCLDATCNIPAGSTLQFVHRDRAIIGVTSVCIRP